MKSIARAILVGGFIVAAQGAVADASAFPGAADDAGVQLSARITYADQHANDSVAGAGLAFPGKAPDGVFLSPNVTYASTHASDPATNVAAAFPGAADDAGVQLPAHSTYADTHLDRHAGLSQPAQGGDAGAD